MWPIPSQCSFDLLSPEIKYSIPSDIFCCFVITKSDMASYIHGYNKERFATTVNRNFLCLICFNVLKDPVLCPRNQHCFCRSCITKHLRIEMLSISNLKSWEIYNNQEYFWLYLITAVWSTKWRVSKLGCWSRLLLGVRVSILFEI
jgi:hypothetical protein